MSQALCCFVGFFFSPLLLIGYCHSIGKVTSEKRESFPKGPKASEWWSKDVGQNSFHS